MGRTCDKPTLVVPVICPDTYELNVDSVRFLALAFGVNHQRRGRAYFASLMSTKGSPVKVHTHVPSFSKVYETGVIAIRDISSFTPRFEPGSPLPSQRNSGGDPNACAFGVGSFLQRLISGYHFWLCRGHKDQPVLPTRDVARCTL